MVFEPVTHVGKEMTEKDRERMLKSRRMKRRILKNEYWTHEELQRIEGVGKLNVLKKYKNEVISRAQNLLKNKGKFGRTDLHEHDGF